MKNQTIKFLLWKTFSHLDDKQLMALVIYGEARGELQAGKVAVGSVILERVDHRDWDGKTIHEVCLCPYQFSCLLPADPNFNALKLIADDWDTKSMRSMAMSECYNVAVGLIDNLILRNSEIEKSHCCQYVTTAYRKVAKKNRWWDSMKLVAIIGAHEFYA